MILMQQWSLYHFPRGIAICQSRHVGVVGVIDTPPLFCKTKLALQDYFRSYSIQTVSLFFQSRKQSVTCSEQFKSAIANHSVQHNHIMKGCHSANHRNRQWIRHIKEFIWIRKANPMNRGWGAHQLSHVYDPFPSKAPSRGQHRRRLGCLPPLWWWPSTRMAETVQL